MSLIQEALKRKSEEEREKSELSKSAPLPTPPKPEPPPVPEQPAQPVAPRRAPVLPVVIILILLIAGGLYFYLNRPTPFTPTETPAVPKAEIVLETEPAAEPEPVIEEEPAPPAVQELPNPAVQETPETEWPELTFSGSAAGGSQVLAIINGRMLSIGDKILGAEVLQIGKTEVLVEYQDEKRVLEVDNQ
ncbi:hypothetical protein [Tichowtungia aerotolerans]|uniref:Uncharacterized protein n=1 Tax=Tichowtungia aerotolerans TaxID=2697043 RepID=A0A6P1MBS6_9BACT|nr:hypothetical protein [Tichowtungia aerotolerans]QHI70553.1 hypothetical protein GT409_14260 [Tichowtungia aerotolerans]